MTVSGPHAADPSPRSLPRPRSRRGVPVWPLALLLLAPLAGDLSVSLFPADADRASMSLPALVIGTGLTALAGAVALLRAGHRHGMRTLVFVGIAALLVLGVRGLGLTLVDGSDSGWSLFSLSWLLLAGGVVCALLTLTALTRLALERVGPPVWAWFTR